MVDNKPLPMRRGGLTKLHVAPYAQVHHTLWIHLLFQCIPLNVVVGIFSDIQVSFFCALTPPKALSSLKRLVKATGPLD